MRNFLLTIYLIFALIVCGCVNTQIKLFTDAEDPLLEFVLEGKAREKLLIIPIKGFISSSPERDFMRNNAGMVQDVVSQLKLAREDKYVKSILFLIDSPGGTATASDILYNEIKSFKEETGIKVVACFMNVAASGAYYISLPADAIIAHPTSITGSIGVIFMRPKFDGLMEKIGIGMEVNKSGKNKDMGSPFRKTTKQEDQLLQELVDDLGNRFKNLVKTHRNIKEKYQDDIFSARIFIANEAKKMGLIDEVGYLKDSIKRAKYLASIPEDSQIIVYRRTEYPNDNIYNITNSNMLHNKNISLFNIELLNKFNKLDTGFYYMWLP